MEKIIRKHVQPISSAIALPVLAAIAALSFSACAPAGSFSSALNSTANSKASPNKVEAVKPRFMQPTPDTHKAPAPVAAPVPTAASAPAVGSNPEIASGPAEKVAASPTPTPKPTPTPIPPQIVKLEQSLFVYSLQNGVLVPQVEISAGSQIAVPNDYQLSNTDYRSPNGKLERSSTGFIFPIKIVSSEKTLATPMEDLNQLAGGLYISAAINGAMQGATGSFNPLVPSKPGKDYLKYFSEIGQPKFSFLKGVTRRFGERLNKGVDPATQTPEERLKWAKIFAELKTISDRTVETPKSLLMMEHGAAKHWSISFETNGSTAQSGTWAIAIQTAIRHGFPETPCAEFMSEIVRQAYLRAGYKMTQDFNTTIGNELIWKNTAAVLNFSRALYKAGWVPWDSGKYRPITGAFMMEGIGQTPGHTFISAGDDGMFIVDNASPQGRDLRHTPESIIKMLYNAGVFFLPPGINPPTWPAAPAQAAQPPAPVAAPAPASAPATPVVAAQEPAFSMPSTAP